MRMLSTLADRSPKYLLVHYPTSTAAHAYSGTAKAAAEEAHPEREEVEAGPVAREVEADQHDEEGKGPEEGVQPREGAGGVDRARRHVRRSKGPPEIGHGRGRADGILEEAAEGRLSDRTETDHRRRVVERAVERAIHGHCTTIVLDLGVLDEIGVDTGEFRKIWNLWEGDGQLQKGKHKTTGVACICM